VKGLATDRAPQPVSEFRILPLERVRAQWDALVGSHPAATLYHRGPWLEVLNRVFSVRPSIAILGDHDAIAAGCLLAPAGLPLRRRLVSMPYSDFCSPLAAHGATEESLLEQIATAMQGQSNLELRGVAAPAPWQVLDHFRHWTLDLARPYAAIEKAADREVRRHLRRAREAGVTIERSVGIDAIDSFSRLQLASRRRLGVPSQPLRFFKTVYEIFAANRAIEVWLASHHGRHIAAVVVLRDGDVVHAKWSTRTVGGPVGASHLIFMSIAQHWAGQARLLDFGRTDIRNNGLTRFKRELGADPSPLPYSYFPRIPNVTSAENLTGAWSAASRVWRNLPLPVVQVLSSMTYRYLA
jgi:hypothetical protein